jgi:membrane-associated phospholipid phosphatase
MILVFSMYIRCSLQNELRWPFDSKHMIKIPQISKILFKVVCVISILLAMEAALVCISRLYVGGHYPLDVGGILLGVGVSLIFVGIEKRIESLMIPIEDTKKTLNYSSPCTLLTIGILFYDSRVHSTT